MVDWELVAEHAEESERLGLDVTTYKVDGSEHVQHLMKNPEKYWSLVERVWRPDD